MKQLKQLSIGLLGLSLIFGSQSLQAKPIEDSIMMTNILSTLSTQSITEEMDGRQPEIEELNSPLPEDLLNKGTLTYVFVEEAKVRTEPSEEGDITHFLDEGEPVVVKERIDNWYNVYGDGFEGYIYRTQLNEEDLTLVPYTRSEANTLPEPEIYLGEEVVTYAKQFLGNPYVYGGNSLTNGVDCSGFTSQIYKHFGISLQRSSRAQYASNGYKVSKGELLPGDLVFYGYNGYIDHVAIYAGNGQIVHASSPKTGIKMSDLEYGKPIIGIKRVIK